MLRFDIVPTHYVGDPGIQVSRFLQYRKLLIVRPVAPTFDACQNLHTPHSSSLMMSVTTELVDVTSGFRGNNQRQLHRTLTLFQRGKVKDPGIARMTPARIVQTQPPDFLYAADLALHCKPTATAGFTKQTAGAAANE